MIIEQVRSWMGLNTDTSACMRCSSSGRHTRLLSPICTFSNGGGRTTEGTDDHTQHASFYRTRTRRSEAVLLYVIGNTTILQLFNPNTAVTEYLLGLYHSLLLLEVSCDNHLRFSSS